MGKKYEKDIELLRAEISVNSAELRGLSKAIECVLKVEEELRAKYEEVYRLREPLLEEFIERLDAGESDDRHVRL